jgi:hypothetical protein
VADLKIYQSQGKAKKVNLHTKSFAQTWDGAHDGGAFERRSPS